jgi:hypothetical protein
LPPSNQLRADGQDCPSYGSVAPFCRLELSACEQLRLALGFFWDFVGACLGMMTASCCVDGSCVLSLSRGAPFLATKPFRFVTRACATPRKIQRRLRCAAHKTRRVLFFVLPKAGVSRQGAKAQSERRRQQLTTNDLRLIPNCQRAGGRVESLGSRVESKTLEIPALDSCPSTLDSSYHSRWPNFNNYFWTPDEKSVLKRRDRGERGVGWDWFLPGRF